MIYFIFAPAKLRHYVKWNFYWSN